MSAPVTPERLAEIDRRRARITPGPWRTYEAYKSLGIEVDEDGPMLFIETGGVTYACNPADAEFTAHAPQDIADLRAEVARLRAQVADALARSGHDANCTCMQPDDDSGLCDCWRAALTSGDQVQP